MFHFQVNCPLVIMMLFVLSPKKICRKFYKRKCLKYIVGDGSEQEKSIVKMLNKFAKSKIQRSSIQLQFSYKIKTLQSYPTFGQKKVSGLLNV